jgi:ABC-type sugar transport system ATPase subunit
MFCKMNGAPEVRWLERQGSQVSATMAAVALDRVEKRFGDVQALDGITLTIAPGEFFSLLDPSGSGKTTTLRLIAGFERPTSGAIFLYGEDVSQLPAFDRDVNTVFQDYALFPHMTVAENVGYGLMVRRVSRSDRAVRVSSALRTMRLDGYQVHRGLSRDVADLDLRQPLAAQPAAHRERGCVRRHHPLRDPGVHRAAAGRRRGEHWRGGAAVRIG